MSLAEELANDSYDTFATPYLSSGLAEGHIVIDSDRNIIVPQELKRLAVQYDHDIETVTFDCPRYWDDHDMSQMNVYINFLRADGQIGVYKADNVVVDSDDEALMHFDWTINRNVSEIDGRLEFVVCINSVDSNGREINRWNSEICKQCRVSEGLEYNEDDDSGGGNTGGGNTGGGNTGGGGSVVQEAPKKRTIGKAAVNYQPYSNWGNTIEEAAQKLSKFDLIVGGGEIHTPGEDTTKKQREIQIIKRARELNPKIKFFYYISIASWRNDNGYIHILDPGGKQPDDSSAPTGYVRLRNKWELFECIAYALHMGGYTTGETELVEKNFTWTDNNGVEHIEDKYIRKFVGGIAFDGVFYDDAGMDSAQGIINQGFKNSRDKSIKLCDFARSLGLSNFVNQLSAANWYDPAISDANPDGLGPAVDKNDYMLVESAHLQHGDSDGIPLWRAAAGGPKACYTYYRDFYPTVGAKIVMNDYPVKLDIENKQKILTYLCFDCFATGAHYLDFNGQEVWDVPELLEQFGYSDDEDNTISNTAYNADGDFTVTKNGHWYRVYRPKGLTQGVKCDSASISKLNITLDGRSMINGFITAPFLDKENDERLEQIENDIVELGTNDKRNASIYHRMMIDDWQQVLRYTNLITDKIWDNFIASVNKNDELISYDDVENYSVCFKRTDYTGQYFITVELNASEYAGHTIEMGCKVNTTVAHHVGTSYIDAYGWEGITGNNSYGSTYYPDEYMYVRKCVVPEVSDQTYIGFKFIFTANMKSGQVYDFSNFYIIDLDEFEEDITKSWYTNIIPPINAAKSWPDWMGQSFITEQIDNESFSIEWTGEPNAYQAWSGISWTVPEGTFKPNHRYELGVNSWTDNIDPYNIEIAFRIHLSGSNPPSYWFPKTIHARSEAYEEDRQCTFFSFGDEYTTNGGGRIIFCSVRSSNIVNDGSFLKAVVNGAYIYDLDEQGIVKRGIDPTNSFLQICRVTEETLAKDKKLVRNALYFVKEGRIFMTDYDRNIILDFSI